jgi:non-ribosomal peptide synthetase component E (peptide arylation enzyme)
MSIDELLHARACTCPETAAIIDTRRGRSRTLSFADLDLAAGRAAALLLQEGLRPGDRVLVLHPMAAELYVALATIFRLGLTAMVLDPSTGRQHIDRCCALAAPRALIGSARAHLLRLLSPHSMSRTSLARLRPRRYSPSPAGAQAIPRRRCAPMASCWPNTRRWNRAWG